MRFVSLTKQVNGKEQVKIVPMTNVSGMDEDEPKPAEVKKKCASRLGRSRKRSPDAQ